MNNIQNKIAKIFGSVYQVDIDERISTFRLNAKLKDVPSPNQISLKALKQYIPERDKFNISLNIDEQDSIGFGSNSSEEEFVSKLKDYFEHYEPDEVIYLKCEIDKNIEIEAISIYVFDAFNEFVGTKSTIDFLDIIKGLKTDTGCINFNFLEKSIVPFHTSKFRFGYEFAKCVAVNHCHLIQANCYFTNSSEYPYSPEDFKLIKIPPQSNNIVTHLNTLVSLFSVVSIFDYSTINKNSLEYKLKGYRLYQSSLSIDDNLFTICKEYYPLYKWIYSSEGNVTDKIGIARNIISLHIDQNNIEIDETLIHSIKSAHQTYLKENVNSYLTIRSNILDELSWISQKSSEVIRAYLQAYKQSSLTFVSFFISIFLLRTLKTGEFSKVFTKEVTIIALAFLGLSTVYLIFSRYNVLRERDRLSRKYLNIKNRYRGLLIQQDIDKILDNDAEFEYEKTFINTRIKNYTYLWFFTIFILLIAILSVSELICFSSYYV